MWGPKVPKPFLVQIDARHRIYFWHRMPFGFDTVLKHDMMGFAIQHMCSRVLVQCW